MEPQNNLIEPTNRTHRMIFIVLIILLTAVIIGGTTFYIMGQQAKKDKEVCDKQLSEIQKQVDSLKKESKTEEKKTETTTPTPIVKDETADWKTYTNTSYSIKYPNYWIVQKDVASDLSLRDTNNESLKVFTQDNNKNLNLRDWLIASFPDANSYVPKNYMNITGYDTGRGGYFFKLTNNKILTITYQTYEGPGSSMGTRHTSDFEQMLNSITIK